MVKRTLVCKRCSKSFVQKLKRENGVIAKYCSQQCSDKPRIERSCEVCKKIYKVIPYRAPKTRWCSMLCRQQAVNNMNPVGHAVYSQKEWQEARERALKRDNYTCQNCGKKEDEATLHVNHILPYRLIQSHILTNLVTLCRECHAKMDWQVRDLLNLHPARKRFLELIANMWLINLKKSNDYAQDKNPMSNFERSNNLGIPPFKGILLRMEDKMSRIEEVSQKNSLVGDESIKDTLVDLANYSLLALIAYEEAELLHSRR